MAKYKTITHPSQTSIIGFLTRKPKYNEDDKNTIKERGNDETDNNSSNLLQFCNRLKNKNPSGAINGPLAGAQVQLSEGVEDIFTLKKEENKESTSKQLNSTT